MTMEISRLGIEVVTTGIREASAALGGLSTSAGNADKRVASLTANLGDLMRVSGSTIGNVSGLTGSMALINLAMQSAAANAAALSQAIGTTAQGLNTLTTATNTSSRSFQNHSYHGGVVVTTLKAMTTAALAYFSIRSAREVIEQSDAWGMMQAKLKLATGSMEDAVRIQRDLFNMAQGMRSPLEDMGKLYVRLAPALSRLGKTSTDTKNMVESVALALKLGGANAGEAAATMLQFSQSANAGRLNGAEFNSVAENGVLILRALEESLGKNQAELKKMGADGKLTFDLIANALESKRKQWEDDFNSLPLTFEGAMQRLKNAWFKVVGEIGQDSGLGKRMAEVLAQLEADMPRIAEVVVDALGKMITVLTFVIDNAKLLGTAFGALLTFGIAKWAVEGSLGFITLIDKLGLATAAANGLSTALKFMGGPWAILLGLLGSAVVAWNLWSDNAVKQSDFTTKNVNKDTDERMATIREEIALLNKRNDAAAGKKAEPEPEKMSTQTQEKLNNLLAKQALLNQQSLPEVRAALQVEVNAAAAAYEHSVAIDKVNKGLKEQLELGAKADAQKAARKDFQKHFATPKEKAEEEIKDWKEKLGDSFTEADAAKIREKHLHTSAKAQKEETAALKAANAELDRSIDLRNRATQALSDYIATNGEDDKMTAGEREVLKLQRELNEAKDVGVKVALKKAIANAQEAAAAEEQLRQAKEAKAVEDSYTKERHDANKAAQEELKTLQDKINTYGNVKGAIENLTLTQARNSLEVMKSVPNNRVAIAEQERLIASLEQVQDARLKLSQLELGTKVKEELDALSAKDIGTDFADSFGKIGKSVDKASKSFEQFNKKMLQIGKAREHALGLDDQKEKQEALLKLDKLEEKANLEKYASMAGAVKSFFNEKTVAYKAFDALEKGIRIVRLAQDAEEFAMKMAQGAEWLAAKVTQAFVAMTVDDAETANSVGNSAVKTVANTTEGVSKAFAQMGVWGFIGAAAIIAFMASMGVGLGGGSGSGGGLIGPDGKIETLEQRQKRQGTGTVLGDDTAKSESIKNSLSRLSDNSNVGLVYTAGMLAALRNIEANIGGLTSSIARVSGLTTGKNFGIQTGTNSKPIGQWLGLFGFTKTVTREIQDTGLALRGTLTDLLTQQYVDVQETTKKKDFFGLFGSTKTTNFREFQDVDADVTSQINAVFKDIGNTILDAASALGGDGVQMREQLKNFVIDTEVSFKDLSGADLEEALNAMFSATADDIAKQLFPSVLAFQKSGEGYFETLTRVAAGTEQAKDALSKLGVSMIGLNDLSQKNGDVGTELVRESLMAAEAGSSLVDILSLLDGSMSDLIEGYKELTNIRNAMQSTGLGSDLTLDLIRGAGGLSELSSAMSDYVDSFFSDEEKQRIAMSKMRMEFGRLHMVVPATKEAFKSLVESLMATGIEGQELAGRVLALSGEFADMIDTFNEYRQEKIDDAKSGLSDAYDKEADALANVRDKMRDFASSLKDFHDSLLTGDLSTKSVMEKYQTAIAKYNDVSSKALTGDQDAIGQYQAVAEELLNLSRQVNASGSGYTSDFERVLSETEALRQFTDNQADVATQNLDLLKQQVDGLIEINDSVKTVAQAIEDLHAAMAITMIDAGAVVDGSHMAGLSNVPFDGYIAELHQGERVLTAAESKQYNAGSNDSAALVAEIKALRDEVKQLKDGQARQTEAFVTATYDANERNAQAVVDGTKSAAADTAYSQRSGIGLN